MRSIIHPSIFNQDNATLTITSINILWFYVF